MKTVFLVLAGVAAVLAAGYGVLWILAKIPVRHRNLEPTAIQRLLRTLLNKGVEGATLVVEVPKDGRFVQFRRVSGRRGGAGLLFGYPRTAWSEPYYEAVAELITEQGLPLRRTRTEGAVSEFLEVDFRGDVPAAEKLATAILTDIYRVVPGRDCIGTLKGGFT